MATNMLRRGDILLSRSDGYMSTWMVPGFWTHAGVYIGRYRGKVCRVCHAVGEGVEDCYAMDFMMHEDYLANIRVKDDTPQAAYDVLSGLHSMVVTRAWAQLNARLKYDHVFDFIDAERVSCTEVPSICYPTKRWGKRRFGRLTVVADDIYNFAADEENEDISVVFDSRKCNADI